MDGKGREMIIAKAFALAGGGDEGCGRHPPAYCKAKQEATTRSREAQIKFHLISLTRTTTELQ